MIQIFTVRSIISLALTPILSVLAGPLLSDDIKPFTIDISEVDLHETYNALKYSRLGPLTFESSHNDSNYGISYEWLSAAKLAWQNDFDW